MPDSALLPDLIHAELSEARAVLDRFLNEPANLARIAEAAELMAHSLRNGGKILTCGNGGSLCDAQHFAEELSGRYRQDRRAMAAIALTDASHMTCVANDYGFEFVFSRFVQALGRPGDVLLAISTSGNSPNVLRAAEAAKEAGMLVVSLTGKDGGQLAGISDVEIRAPHAGYADRIQEIHIKAIHILIMLIEKLTL
ncbi:D-sedoheptulose 7-phosphate isomerase [Hymenobacter sp. BT770]|uniref:D-sedoheptulose 7-phosphate isomerase n=1 Tax=Hymenobacter sp. BT770 TaxID=2886942 RepID=UPI001D0FBE56|nr:D-sedoheptulose 7-phosphate isomerase [Hymenobacter sp. BT770]MCC3154844.1 D-sedoheptulose 7-phosphate isomerase [Hymenobacter sp. BT770]MDO3416781.1 D-sedoheptulose 7-phosphate isomerase [Hymenobacter sp. BT770]